MRCNRLGEFPAPETIKVQPGDIVSFEWGHEDNFRMTILLPSVTMVRFWFTLLIGESWVKLFEEGKYEPNKWAATYNLPLCSIDQCPGTASRNFLLL